MSKISKNDISSFFQKNWKYFTAVILFVVLAVVGGVLQEGKDDTHHSLGRFLSGLSFVWFVTVLVIVGLFGWSSVLAFLAAMLL